MKKGFNLTPSKHETYGIKPPPTTPRPPAPPSQTTRKAESMKKIKLYLVIDDVDYVQVFTDEDEAWEHAGDDRRVQEAEITVAI